MLYFDFMKFSMSTGVSEAQLCLDLYFVVG